MVAAENDALPNGKVGGIGDVIRDIPKFLAQKNVHVDVIVPGYQYQSTASPSELLLQFEVPFREQKEIVSLYKIALAGDKNVHQYVLEHPLLHAGKPGQIYFDDGADKPFYSDANKFAFFCISVCELVTKHWFDQVDIMHLHDWHSAMVSILRQFDPTYKRLKSIRTVYSVHNLAIQGIRPLEHDASSLKSWFPWLCYQTNLINDPRYIHCLNPTRAAINLSDAVHVVSPTYANEVLKPSDPENGFIGGEGLELDLMNAFEEGRLFGILNGCDYDVRLPNKISELELIDQIQQTISQFSTNDEGKSQRLKLAKERCHKWAKQATKGPLLLSIGRLTEQKIKLLFAPSQQGLVIDAMMQQLGAFDARLIILGSGDIALEKSLATAMKKHTNLLFINGYFASLSDQLYVNGDLFLMPSSFEPCGISQMLAMRAGQPCLAHRIGGLGDTIDHLTSGFLFSGATIKEQTDNMLSTLMIALKMITSAPSQWQKMQHTAKSQRFLWSDSINDYIQYLYNQKMH